jgi:ABC-type phosphate transport system auxiliary subunit
MVSDNASEGDLSNSDYLVDRITTLNNLKNEFDVDSRQYKDLSNQVLELSQSKIETEFNEMNEKQKKKRFNELVANKEKIMNDIDEMNEADDDYDTNMQKLDYTIKVANTELDTFTKLLNKDRKHK